ncbi:hypothetical protein ACGFZS_46960 [Streptomyces sp. NPDC048288]|uniref:hypothetical protein n=1 Tax=Streptomyces sp. NPDC048288 TaxID=3365529 RepID=UPI00371C8D26
MTSPDDPAWRWEFRCEDFVYARLADAQTAAEQLPPGPARDTELHRVDSLYLIASQHNIWVDARGQSAGRCITCLIADGGVPCLTMTGLARLFHQHPDYKPGWNRIIDDPGNRAGTYTEYKKRSTIYERRAAVLIPFYELFDLQRDRDGEYWQCRTCPARGKSHRPLLPGGYDYPYAIDDATRDHPACPERTTT